MTPKEELAMLAEADRNRTVGNAARAMLDGGHSADVVRQAATVAGLRWDDAHPLLASRIGATA